MRNLFRHFPKQSFLLILILILFILFVYRDAVIGKKVFFPTNYLVSFFAPWSEEKFPGWDQGVPFKPIGTDQIRFFYPGRSLTNEAFKKGVLPLWDPYIFSGNPHLANFQSAVFYPLSIIYFFLPQLTAWSILTMSVPILGFAFCFLYLRSLSVGRPAAFLGAFSFGFSGFLLSWSQEAFAVAQSAVWLPLIFWGIEKYFQTFSPKFILAGALALVMSILAGYLQITFYITVLAVFYIFSHLHSLDSSKRRKAVTLFILAAFFTLTVSAVQTVPSLEGFFLSPRPTVRIDKVFETYLLSPAFLLHALAPDIDGNPATNNYFGRGSYNETVLYIGVAPFIFALLAVWKLRKEKYGAFFAGSALVSFILTSNLPGVKEFLNLPWPLVPTFQPSRILFITTFSLSVLAAIGFDWWKKSGKPFRIWWIGAAAIAILLATTAWHIMVFVHDYFLSLKMASVVVKPLPELWKHSREFTAAKNIILPIAWLGGTIILTLPAIPKRLAFLGIIVLTIFSQFYFFNKYLSLGEKQFLYPEDKIISAISQNQKDFSRYLSLGRPVFGNIATQMKLYSPEGFDPIFVKRYGQLAKAAQSNGLLTEDIARIEVNLSDLPQSTKEAYLSQQSRPRLRRLFSLLGVKTITYFPVKNFQMDSRVFFPENIFTPVATVSGWQIYQLKNVLPRAFLAENAVVETNPAKILDRIFDPGLDPSKTIILEKRPVYVGNSPGGDFVDKASIVSYLPEEVIIKTLSSGSRFLFLSDNYYPGWKATVDGKPSEIYRADFTFRAVALGPGEHLVRFVYQPDSVAIGGVISLASLGVFLLISGFWLLRRRLP